jgi:hypothetical protein
MIKLEEEEEEEEGWTIGGTGSGSCKIRICFMTSIRVILPAN